nr:gamma-glutamylcyclotransferase family protein [uncultured Muriicola sp.]
MVTIEKPLVASATEYLFTYGTLQDKEVQQMVFSRILKGNKDHLKEHTISKELVGGLYPTVRSSPQSVKGVPGIVYIISKDELQRVDVYEGDAYFRKKVMLSSGTEAWVYLGKTKS